MAYHFILHVVFKISLIGVDIFKEKFKQSKKDMEIKLKSKLFLRKTFKFRLKSTDIIDISEHIL